MLTGSDLSEILTDFMIKPLGDSRDLYQRTEEAAKELANDTYAANLAAETLPAVRMLHWNDVPAALGSMLRYPMDLGCAQLQAWQAWLNFVDKQCAMLRGVALTVPSPPAVRRLPGPEPATTVEPTVVPLAARASGRSRVPRRASAGV